MSSWSEFYKGRVGDSYVKHVENKYFPFIEEIIKNINELQSKNPTIIEYGCGIGSITKILLGRKVDATFILVDNDIDMLQLAKENLKDYLKKYKVIFIQGDWRSLPIQCDLIMSHGVLEHLTNLEVNQVLKVQHKKSIHYVPGNKYLNPSFGDERLLPPRYWEALTGHKVKTFNRGYDYILTK